MLLVPIFHIVVSAVKWGESARDEILGTHTFRTDRSDVRVPPELLRPRSDKAVRPVP
jgi:hypothetical protein